MSHRPPSDTFTRFTSTSPHASQKPKMTSFSSQPPSSSSSGFNVASPSGETPAQKVARLRAASQAAKQRNSMSRVDRMINTGRVFADRAHRVTTYTLIGFTGVATVIALFSMTSLITHNRRQKRAWIDREMDRLRDAQMAFLRGEANAEQLHLLEQERAGEEMADKKVADKKRRKEESYWSKLKGLVRTGTAVGEMGHEEPAEIEGRELRAAKQKMLDEAWVEGEIRPALQRPELVPVAVRQSGVKGVGYDEKGRPVPAGKMMQAVRQLENERRTGEDEIAARTGITGGPLDVLAGNVVDGLKSSTSRDAGWLSWLRGSKS